MLRTKRHHECQLEVQIQNKSSVKLRGTAALGDNYGWVHNYKQLYHYYFDNRLIC